MSRREQLIIEIRAPGSSDSLPDGWAAESMRWDGREVDVAYDPRLVRVARLRAGPGSDLRRNLAANGWRHVSTDSENAELWIVTTEESAMARLNRLAVRAAGFERQSLGID